MRDYHHCLVLAWLPLSLWLSALMTTRATAFVPVTPPFVGSPHSWTTKGPWLLSSDYLENDLVAIARPSHDNNGRDSTTSTSPPRLCAVKPDGSVAPLCRKEDDVETDLFVDPREYAATFWTDDVSDEHVVGGTVYGEGFYGQRPVPSLGGGPGYGAEADDVWSVEEEVLEQIRRDGVLLPILDMGISHGEKARAGAF